MLMYSAPENCSQVTSVGDSLVVLVGILGWPTPYGMTLKPSLLLGDDRKRVQAQTGDVSLLFRRGRFTNISLQGVVKVLTA